jgi:phosphosulfolactate phosphohydrolase-like enzyme
MPGLIRGVARTAAVAGTATAVSNRVSRRQGERWAAKDEEQYAAQQQEYAAQQYAAQQAVPQQSTGTDMDKKMAQLKELGQLKEQGLLSDVEFEVQKNKILNG